MGAPSVRTLFPFLHPYLPRRGPKLSMKRFSFATTALAAAAAITLGALPSQAHGTAFGGGLAGLLHPLQGVDHLLMLLAVGTAASQLSFQLLPWALGGGLIGALCGLSGWTVPLLESLAALAVMAVAGISLLSASSGLPDRALRLLSGGVVGVGVAMHAALHGLEAPAGPALLWWGGVLLSSVVLCGGTAWLLRRFPKGWGRSLALAVLMAGGLLVFAS